MVPVARSTAAVPPTTAASTTTSVSSATATSAATSVARPVGSDAVEGRIHLLIGAEEQVDQVPNSLRGVSVAHKRVRVPAVSRASRATYT